MQCSQERQVLESNQFRVWGGAVALAGSKGWGSAPAKSRVQALCPVRCLLRAARGFQRCTRRQLQNCSVRLTSHPVKPCFPAHGKMFHKIRECKTSRTLGPKLFHGSLTCYSFICGPTEKDRLHGHLENMAGICCAQRLEPSCPSLASDCTKEMAATQIGSIPGFQTHIKAQLERQWVPHLLLL